MSGQWYCHFNECALAYDGRRRSYPDTNQASIVCQHIKEAQNSQCSRECAQNIHLSSSVLNSLPVPPAVRAEFEAYLIESRTQVIQRVSKKSFVVVTSPSAEAPFGLLHIRTGPNNNIQCTCHKYKRATSLASATTAPKLSKRCTHFYLFLWATLSNESLKKEFSLSDIGE